MFLQYVSISVILIYFNEFEEFKKVIFISSLFSTIQFMNLITMSFERIIHSKSFLQPYHFTTDVRIYRFLKSGNADAIASA